MSATGVFLRVAGLLIALAVGFIGSASGADDLTGIGDPTRPPPGVMVKRNGTPGAAGAPGEAASGASVPDDDAQPKPVELSLQAIRFIPDTGHAVAMINGELVEVGDTVTGMRVMTISRTVTVLKGPGGLRRLTLELDSDESNSKPTSGEGAATGGRKESK